MKEILFIVNGLGLGNSTRCHAIIQHLARNRARVSVATSGNGLWYYSDCPDIHRLDELETWFYSRSGGNLSIWRTAMSVRELVSIQRVNSLRINQILESLKPDLVVMDSTYNYAPMRRRGIPVAALNNADVVVRAYRYFKDAPTNVKAQFYLVECSDWLLHAVRPDLLISPTVMPLLGRTGGRYRSVGAIVRQGYEPSTQRKSSSLRIVIMLSGSVFGTVVRFDRKTYPGQINVIGRGEPNNWTKREDVKYLGKIKDTRPLLAEADLLVVNGGFSAVSEAFAMRKPMIVVPIRNHAEQWLNARTIAHLGVGLISEEEAIEQTIDTAAMQIDSLRAAYNRIDWQADGAEQAANALVTLTES